MFILKTEKEIGRCLHWKVGYEDGLWMDGCSLCGF